MTTINAPRPTEYRVTKRGRFWPYRVEARNPATHRWNLQVTIDDRCELRAWLKDRGINAELKDSDVLYGLFRVPEA